MESSVNRRRFCGEQEGSRGGPLSGECVGEMPAARGPWEGEEMLSEYETGLHVGFTKTTKDHRSQAAKLEDL